MERWERIERLGPQGGVYVTPQYSFGSDAMLLAHFAAPRGVTRVCELGAGCGIISLLWCGGRWRRRLPEITAVELQPAAAALATRSVARNGLCDHIRVVQADWRALEGVLPAGHFEQVTCNPPYFPADSGDVSADEARRLARHEDGPDALDALCTAAARLLQNGGRFSLCHRPERLCDLLIALRRAGLEPKRLQWVQQEDERTPWLLLCEAKKGAKPGLQTLPTLVLRRDGAFTPTYRRIYGMRG